MAQIDLLMAELKRRLREGKLTYAGIAAALGLSESAVKRMFASRNMTLQRLEQVCNLLDLEISDIVATMHDKRRYLTELTPEQEDALVADPKLLLMAFLVVNGWRLEEIVAEYEIEEQEAERLLIRLSRIRLIELLPFNRFKLRTARNFTWRPKGPVRRFFEEEVQREFLHDDFSTDMSKFRFMAGRLSRAGVEQIQQAMERLASEFDQLVERDSALPRASRPVFGAVLAIRPWEYSVFAGLRRKTGRDAKAKRLMPSSASRRAQGR